MATLLPQMAQADCAPASDALKSLVCSSDGLAKAWIEIETGIDALGRAQPGLTAPLAEDQALFETLLEKTLGDLQAEHPASEVPEILLTGLQDRLAFLAAIEPGRDGGLDGLWGNAAGSMLIGPEGEGRTRVQLSVMEPIMGLATCSLEATGAFVGALLTVVPTNAPQTELTLMKLPDAAVLGADFTRAGRAAQGPINCENSPAITGWYFPVKQAN